MSINYSPELVRALMQERILEAQTARLGKEIQHDAQIAPAGTLVSRLSRLMVRRPAAPTAAPTTAACPTC